MEKAAAIMTLVMFTLLVALGVGFYQLFSVERAKKEGSQSAMGDRNNRNSRPS